ncbi:hypothetical protein JCM14076_10680 [Methylosoma difficile]
MGRIAPHGRDLSSGGIRYAIPPYCAINGLNDQDLKKLVKNIETGNCVLMLGSDIAADNQNTVSLASLFARQLAG